MEVSKLGDESELQLLAYTIATAMLDPSHICDLHCRLQQCQILNTLSEARDWTCILMDTSQVLNPLSHNGNSQTILLFYSFEVYVKCWNNGNIWCGSQISIEETFKIIVLYTGKGKETMVSILSTWVELEKWWYQETVDIWNVDPK